MDFEKLRKKLLDYYGTAAGPFPAAWGDVLAVQRADEAELIRMAYDAGIDFSGAISADDMREALEQYYEAAGFAGFHDRMLKDLSDDEIRRLFFETYC